MLNGLDLFSGIGGISLALSPWVRAVAYCERDRYAQSVLLSRMRDGALHCAPIWDDIRTLSVDHICTPEIGIDIICGGFPCQDISVAGAGAGLAGERSGLFFEIVRLTRGLRPRFVFLENVPAISIRGLDRVLLEFTALGYDCRWTTLSAASVGAPHRRERWFLLAHARDGGQRGVLQSECELGRSEQANTRSDGEIQPLARAGSEWWATEPTVGRVANGIPNRVDRIKCLGNSVVPLQVRTAFEFLINGGQR